MMVDDALCCCFLIPLGELYFEFPWTPPFPTLETHPTRRRWHAKTGNKEEEEEEEEEKEGYFYYYYPSIMIIHGYYHCHHHHA